MNVRYVKEENYYLISNHAVARNALFRNEYYCVRFIYKFRKYLSDLCEIVSYHFDEDQFHLLVRMKSRDSFSQYYIRKQNAQGKEIEAIPESTYIFSQAMANLQSSMAIHLNRRENRTGALFARRFSKKFIGSKEELVGWINRFNERAKLHRYIGRWRYERKRVRDGVGWWRNVGKDSGFWKGEKSKWSEIKSWLFKELQGHSLNQSILYFSPDSKPNFPTSYPKIE